MLSIIIPTLNEEKYLPHLLESIEKQNFVDYEVIVADAGSEDKTREVAKEYGCRVVEGGFPAESRNNGAEVAEGDLFLFVDADVTFPRDFLEKSLAEFNQEDLGVATTLFRPRAGRFLRGIFEILYTWPVLLLENTYPHANCLVLVRKEIHQQLDGFDEEIKLGEDEIYVRKAAKKYRFGILRSVRFIDSIRRFEQKGWLKTYLKYVLADFYMFFKGPIKTDIFNYNFDHES